MKAQKHDMALLVNYSFKLFEVWNALRMARRNDLSSREKAICVRLKEFREHLGLSRVAFAKQAGVDSSVIARHELHRVPVRYETARLLHIAFGVSPVWLATGDYAQWFPQPLPSAKELGVKSQALLSEVDAKKFCKSTEEMFASVFDPKDIAVVNLTTNRTKYPVSAVGRIMAAECLATEAEEWLASVPDEKLNDFIEDLYSAAESLLTFYGKTSKAELQKRQREIAREKSRILARKKILEKKFKPSS